ncbi:MAG TPA: CDC27 family protein [Gemmatimonadales bacterium]|nr:CDC27 family protein [Gemmatimonadales bacterium]
MLRIIPHPDSSEPARMFLMRRIVVCVCLVMAASPLHAQKVKLLVPLDSLIARVQRDSNDAPAHYEVALGYWLAKKYDLAEAHLREAIAIEPKTATAYLALSYLPFARNYGLWGDVEKGKVSAEWLPKVEEADHLRRQAFLLDPLVDLRPLALMIPPTGTFGLSRRESALYTYIMNGLGSFWTGDYSKSYQFFSSIAEGATEEDRKKFADWFLWYEGLSATHTFQYSRGVADFRLLLDRAIARENPDSNAIVPFESANEFRYALAVILDKAGQQAEAIKLLQESVTSDLGLYMAHVRLAEIYEEQHRTKSALQERRRALEASPDDPGLLYDLGEALYRAGELSDAYGFLEKAVKANPRSVRALYMFGSVAQKLEQTEEAKAAYTKFIAIAPSRFQEQIVEAGHRLETMK